VAPSGHTHAEVISDFNHRVLTEQPLRVVAGVLGDSVKLFALGRATSPGDTPISRWQFQTSYPTYGTSIYLSPDRTIMLGLHYATSGGPEITQPLPASMGGRAAVDQPLASFLRSYQLNGGYTPGPLLALAAAAGLFGSLAVGGLAIARRRAGPAQTGALAERRAAQYQLALACLLMFGAAVAVLLASDAFEFSWRYQLPAVVTLPPAGALGIALGISLLRRPRLGTSTGRAAGAERVTRAEGGAPAAPAGREHPAPAEDAQTAPAEGAQTAPADGPGAA
jgi:hypothetical protein